MLIHIERMRLRAIECLVRAYIITSLPFSLVKAKLNLPSEADAQEIVRAAGYHQE